MNWCCRFCSPSVVAGIAKIHGVACTVRSCRECHPPPPPSTYFLRLSLSLSLMPHTRSTLSLSRFCSLVFTHQAVDCVRRTLPAAVIALSQHWPLLESAASHSSPLHHHEEQQQQQLRRWSSGGGSERSRRHHVLLMTQPVARTRLKGVKEEKRRAVNSAVRQFIAALQPIGRPLCWPIAGRSLGTVGARRSTHPHRRPLLPPCLMEHRSPRQGASGEPS
jgi:hypothetical protein